MSDKKSDSEANEENSGVNSGVANNPSHAVAKWTQVVAIFTVVLALAAIASNITFFWQLSVMQGQLDEMRAANERPYLMTYVAENDILRGDADLKNCPPSKEESCFPNAYISLVIENAGRQPAILEEAVVGISFDDVEGLARKIIQPPSMLLDGDFAETSVAMLKLNGECKGLEGVSRIPSGGSITIKCVPTFLDSYADEVIINKKLLAVRGAINYRGPSSQAWQSGFQFTYVPPKINSKSIGHFKPTLDQNFTYDVIRGKEPAMKFVK